MDLWELMQRPFSIEEHKKHFIHYLEVVISPFGDIEYATPSHEKVLIQKVMERNGWTREQFTDAVVPMTDGAWMEWLVKASGGFLPVWTNHIPNVSLTKEQWATLRKLKLAGIYEGALPSRGSVD